MAKNHSGIEVILRAANKLAHGIDTPKGVNPCQKLIGKPLKLTGQYYPASKKFKEKIAKWL